jgi:hypothetical protein
MKKSLLHFTGAAALIILLFSSISCTGERVRLKETPEETATRMINNPEFERNANGENFCWHARVGLDRFVENYELTGDTEWLDAGIRYFDFLTGKMAFDPDGYKGWIGVYGYDDRYWQDALVGDAILLEGILDFAVLVHDNPALEDKYREKASEYVKIAEKDFFEKWDKRGCWIDDGPFGTYIEFNRYLKADSLDRWISGNGEETRAGISHPFNKQMDAAQVFLRLWRITGKKVYRDRAEKIFFTAKNHFQFYDDHYCWNYYEPLYPGDVDTLKKDTRHGVWVHPWRSGYQASEVEKIAEAYHYGIVFDEQDMRRIINTNLRVMWNGDRENPRFISSNGLGADNDTSGLAEFRRNWGHSNVTKNSGELWTGLLDFDQTIRDLYEQEFKGDHSSREYLLYRKTVLSDPPGFKRKFAEGDVSIPDVKFTESRELCMVAVLPHSVRKNSGSIIICKTLAAGELSIDLLTSDGVAKMNLYRGKTETGTFLVNWKGKDQEGKDLPAGSYKIRWTLGTGYREFPVIIE